MKRFSIAIFAYILVASFFNIEAEPIIEDLGNITIHIWHDRKLTWKKARKFCNSHGMGMGLLSLESAEKNEKVNKVLRNKGFMNSMDIGNDYIYWTSGNDLKNEGQFIWKTRKQKFTYTNWLTGMPDNWRNDENCVEMGFKELGKWNDNRCWYHRHFICEIGNIDIK